MSVELPAITVFKNWLVGHGAFVHPDIHFEPVSSGLNVIAREDVPADNTVVSIPFSLAITPEVSRKNLKRLLGCEDDTLDGLTERQLECTYICMHWIVDSTRAKEAGLHHGPYIDTLPTPEKLRTPLHFSPAELQAFEGTNLYGATLDRQRDWQAEWHQCKAVVDASNSDWGSAFTWERYLTASTYLSSRAFPSTLLSATPSLLTTPTSHPVLLPGIDALNHARGHPVSWAVSSPSSSSSSATTTTNPEASISLVIHAPTPRGAELFNNYGPKPNAELILGYGFSLPHNPDDTIVLKIGGGGLPASNSGSPSSASGPGRWEVGRDARGAKPVWDAVLAAVCAQNPRDEEEGDDGAGAGAGEPSIEDELCAADTLADMAAHLHDRLPSFPPSNAGELRPDVVRMLKDYLEGQREILRALVTFAREKEVRAVERARALGLDLVDEELEEEEDGEEEQEE